MKSPKPKHKKSSYLKWRKRILITLLVLLLVPTTLFTIGWLSRDTVINYLQDWYNENNSGTLEIGKVDANFLSGFPNVGFTLRDIKQTHIDTISDTYSSTEINQTKLSIGVGDLLRGNIQFKKIEINGAKFASVVKSQKSRGYHQQLMREKDKDLGKGIIMPTWLHEDGVDFTLTDVHFIETDTILNKAFDIKVNTINGYYNRNNSQLDGNFTFDASVNTLGFNTQKGTYFNGARVRGRPEFSIDLEKDFISVSEFLFKVDAQDFNLKANFDFSGIETYAFQLKNDNTNFESLKTLLPENMSSNLLLYDIDNPLKTDLNLSGNFLYNDDPVIDVIFSTQDNNILLDDRIQLKNVSFDGHLTTEIYDTDSLKAAKRTGYDLKIGFKDLTATYDEIAIKVNNGYYQSSPDAWNIVKTDLSVVGDNASLTKLIDTDNFDFVGGTFQLKTNIDGDLSNINEFANNATGYFNLKKTRVILKKNGLQLPISTIDLLLEREKSTLERLVVNFPNGENLVLQGQLKSISSLLSKNPKTPTTSTITVRSRALNINDVLSLANQFMPPSQQNIDNRKNLHETLDAVYNQFNPNFNMNLGALTFNDFTISDVTSNIDLINDETIVLNNFGFNYLNTNTKLKGRVVVPKPNGQLRNPIFINALASSNGDISVFQDLFNIQLFRIDDGSYQFNGTINGNIHKFNALLNNAKGNLALNNTKLHYNQTDTDIEIDSLALFIDESDMILKKLNLEISELYTLNLSGKITEFQGFLIDEIPNKGAIELKISAPFLNANEVLTTFKDSKNEENLKVLKRKDALYKIFKDINNFKPKIEIAFDSLKYQDLLTKNVNGLVYFENDSLLKLKNLDFSYKQTNAKIKGQLNAHTQQKQLTNNNPFDIDVFVDIEGKSENLNSYFKTKNFNFTSGDFEFKGEYKAQSKDLKILNSKGFGDLKMMNTIVDYKAAGLKIPLDSLHINIEDNVASIKTIDINLPGKSSVFFSGSIDHFSDFINNEQNDNGRGSDITMHSPYLSTTDIYKFLSSTSSKNDKASDQAFSINNFKEALSGINSSFYPTATIKIDTLKHDTLDVTDFNLNFLFNSKGDLQLQDTQLNFYGGTLEMDVDAAITTTDKLPVKIDLHLKDIDLQELVSRLDYFDSEALRNADKVAGMLNININATGNVNDTGTLDMSSLNGTFKLDIANLELHNFKPIMENSVLMKDQRFARLSFRPIVQTFKISDGELIIPRTEIQSSAIQIFAEGRLKFNEYLNIWLSIPWKNLKSNDGLTLPEKTTYAQAGSKFYIQLLQNKSEKKEKNRDLKVKFRLSNRKLRKMKSKN